MTYELPRYRLRFLHLAALWAYGVSQPVFSLLEANPEFLVVRGSTRGEVIVFALLVGVVPPLLALGIEWSVSRLAPRAADGLHLVLLGLFALPLAVRVVGSITSSELLLLSGSAAVCLSAVLLYVRWRAVQLFLAYSIVLPVAGLLMFVHGIPLTTDTARAADVRAGSPVPIVLVILDEFPVSSLLASNGQIDAVRYPGFGQLARASTWYPNATTVHQHTTSAVPAILTGRLPHGRQLPTLGDHPENVFALLARSYDFRVRELFTHLCPTDLCARERTGLSDRLRGLITDVGVVFLHDVLPDSVADRLPSIDNRWSGFLQQGRIQSARTQDQLLEIFDRGITIPGPDEYERFLAGLRVTRTAGTFHAIHLFMPHAPWRYLPSGHQYGFGETIDGVHGRREVWARDPWLVTQGLQRHLLQVGYTDALVGRLVHQLRAGGLYDRALVVVVADHGASFIPGDYRRDVNARNIAEIAGVPLFVKYPGQRRGRVDSRAARTIDIVPTIAEVVGTRIPWRVDGRPLLGPAPTRREVMVGRLDGSFVRTSLTRVTRMRQQAIGQKALLFGEGSASLYRIGRSQELLGARVGRTIASQSISASLDRPEWFANVRRSSPYIPSRISGWIDRGVMPSSVELAIAVNGRVRALTRVFRDGRRQRFRALVPPSTLVEGGNRIDVYAIRLDRTTRLAWLGSS